MDLLFRNNNNSYDMWGTFELIYLCPTANELRLIEPFLERFPIEFENWEERFMHRIENLESNWLSFMEHYQGIDMRPRIIKFLEQVRETKGYGVDEDIDFSVIPAWKHLRVFLPQNLTDEGSYNLATKAATFALGEFNKFHKLIMKSTIAYEFEGVEKLVLTTNDLLLLTFIAKEVATGEVETFEAMIAQAPHFEVMDFKTSEGSFRIGRD